MDKKVYVTLENGKVFEGYSFGAEREVVGELVFTTGMTGYIETLTDPSYFGQIVTQTFPSSQLRHDPRRLRERQVLGERLYRARKVRCSLQLPLPRDARRIFKAQNIPAVYGVDTRELTKIVREAGVMPAAITFEPLKDVSVLKGYKVKDAVKSVTGHEKRESGPEGGKRIVLYDFGAKGNIVKELLKRGCHVIEVPADTTAEEALSFGPTASCSPTAPAIRRKHRRHRRDQKDRGQAPRVRHLSRTSALRPRDGR